MIIKGLISFIILTYKNFDGIYDTLDSLFEQDYPEIELVISDDCSPDADTILDDIEDYINANKSVNIKNVIIRRGAVNLGTVKNINEAIRLSSGEYIKDLGAEDTMVDSGVLTRYKDFLDNNNLLICCAKLQGITENGEKVNNLASCEEDYDTLRSYSPLELRDRLFVRNCLPAPAFFMKRELLDTYGMYPEEIRLIEDYPYWLHLCTKGVKIGFMDERLINYKLNGISSAGHYSKMFMDDMLIIYEKYIFPYDKRFGVFQKFYNQLKRDGLNTYIALAEWEDYSFGRKIANGIRYGIFFIYIKLFMKQTK